MSKRHLTIIKSLIIGRCIPNYTTPFFLFKKEQVFFDRSGFHQHFTITFLNRSLGNDKDHVAWKQGQNLALNPTLRTGGNVEITVFQHESLFLTDLGSSKLLE
jgi:hypothetical protein